MATVKKMATSKGTAYRVRWTDPDDRDREKWLPSAGAARAFANEVETNKNRGVYVDPRPPKLTLRAAAEKWLGSLTKATPRTLREYRRLLETRVYPHFDQGRRPLASIDREAVTGYVFALREAGVRPQTIANAYAPLRATLRHAAAEGLIPKSPAVGVELPDAKTLGVEEFAATYMEWPTVEAVADRAGARAPMFGLIIRLTACTGLREAELVGLEVRDVTIRARDGALSVRRTRTPDATAPGGWKVTTTKGRRSREVPVLNPSVRADLAAYLRTHPRRADPGALLFFGQDGHGRTTFNPDQPLNGGEFLKRVLKPAAAAVGVAVRPARTNTGQTRVDPVTGEPLLTSALRFHDLRHTAASLWASSSIDIFKVSRWLGHKSTAITEAVYAHLFQSRLDREEERYTLYLADQARAAEEGRSNVVPINRVS